MTLHRSYLFVPGNRPERFAKALDSAADAVVIDLEDAVTPAAKPAARDAVAAWLAVATDEQCRRVCVRINDAASPWHGDDLHMLAARPPAWVMLPKAESAETLAAVRAVLPGAGLLPLVETARGVARAEAIAAADGVLRLVFGTLDLAVDLGVDIEPDAEPLAEAAARLVLASRLADRAAPVAGVTPQLDDDDRLRADTAWALRRGFGAKLCIHPRQVAAVHDALRPPPERLDWARRVLQAEAASPGAAQLDGRMIDRPVVLLARQLMARAGG